MRMPRKNVPPRKRALQKRECTEQSKYFPKSTRHSSRQNFAKKGLANDAETPVSPASKLKHLKERTKLAPQLINMTPTYVSTAGASAGKDSTDCYPDAGLGSRSTRFSQMSSSRITRQGRKELEGIESYQETVKEIYEAVEFSDRKVAIPTPSGGQVLNESTVLTEVSVRVARMTTRQNKRIKESPRKSTGPNDSVLSVYRNSQREPRPGAKIESASKYVPLTPEDDLASGNQSPMDVDQPDSDCPNKPKIKGKRARKYRPASKLVTTAVRMDFDESDSDLEPSPPKKAKGRGNKAKKQKPVPKKNVSSKKLSANSHKKISKDQTGQDSSGSSESEWEEVEDANSPIKSQIPSKGVEIVLDQPDILKKKKKKGFDWQTYFRRQWNRYRKSLFENKHKVHLLMLLSHGRYLNQVCHDVTLNSVALSLTPNQVLNLSYQDYDVDTLKKVVRWFKDMFKLKEKEGAARDVKQSAGLRNFLLNKFATKTASCLKHYVLMFVLMLRSVGALTRLMLSLDPLPQKPIKKDSKKNTGSPQSIHSPKKKKVPTATLR